MALNFQNNSPAPVGRVSLIIALVVALGLVGIYAAEGPDGPLHKVQAAVAGIAAPVQSLGTPVGQATEGAAEAP